ncbi:DnaB-like helicase C-terminal domain-containing protein [Ligilactobacillus agilis]|uniref:DnaB-like helicase C-terminal domain-containing protein n=1 Tax=Ligilactobacillus agilis TaxID=1601 RepID=UPI003D803DA8
MFSEKVEERVIGIALKEPELADSPDFQSRYFIDDRFRAIAEALNALTSEKRTLANVWNELDNSYNQHNFPIGYEDLVALEELIGGQASFYRDLQVIKRNFLENNLQLAMVNYCQNRSQAQIDKITSAIEALNTINTCDTGELTKASQAFSDQLAGKGPELIKTIPKLDKLFNGGLIGSKLIALGARPGLGKTAFGLNLVQAILQQNPAVHVDFFSLEMSKLEILKRLLSLQTQIPHSHLVNPTGHKLDVSKLAQAQAQILASNLQVYDSLRTLSSILTVIQAHASQYPHRYVVFIDYLGLITLEQQYQLDRYLQVSEITRQLKMCTLDYQLPIVMLSQLNRAVESRLNKAPQLADLRESGSIEQDANLVAFLYRPEKDLHKINLIVRKNREGCLGEVNFNFKGETMSFD